MARVTVDGVGGARLRAKASTTAEWGTGTSFQVSRVASISRDGRREISAVRSDSASLMGRGWEKSDYDEAAFRMPLEDTAVRRARVGQGRLTIHSTVATMCASSARQVTGA